MLLESLNIPLTMNPFMQFYNINLKLVKTTLTIQKKLQWLTLGWVLLAQSREAEQFSGFQMHFTY